MKFATVSMTASSLPAFPEAALLPLLERVEELGRFLVERQSTVSFTYKSDGTVLSDLDLETQREIHACIRGLPFEQAAAARFVAEEEDPGSDASHIVVPGSWNWIVDAIDGTSAYTKGLNTFGISIALVDGDCAPLLGIVHLPAWNGRFDVAWLGGRYSWSGKELQPAGGSSLPPEWSDPVAAPLSRSYIYAHSDLHRRGLDTFSGKVRNLGGTAAHLALLAEATEDPIAVVLSRCDTWDVAAGLALASAAAMEIRHGIDWQIMTYRELMYAKKLKETLPVIVGLPEMLRLVEPQLKGRLH